LYAMQIICTMEHLKQIVIKTKQQEEDNNIVISCS
jgi:hypothetical protein